MFKKMFVCVFYFIFGVLCVQTSRLEFDRYEGQLCQTEEAAGKCVHIYKCLSSILDLKKKSHPMICSFERKEPIICCTDCELVNDTRNAIVDNNNGIYFKTGQKARDKCIEHLRYLPYSCDTSGMERTWDHQKQCHKFEYLYKTAAVGGKDAERSQYPHMALLGYGDDPASSQWLCGGSLISERFILTAAHCTAETALGPVRFVALGILKRSDPDEYWQIYNVKRVISHPEYRPPSKYHDIALLETDRTIQFNIEVFPACLDFDGDKSVMFNNIAYATGWGKLGKNRPLADTLQEVTVNVFSQEECLQHYPPARLLKQGYDQNTQLCYGDRRNPKDTCEGDSGGPLQVKSQVSNCLHTLLGVTSFGRACGYAGVAGMYSRVRHYVPWIESVVWPE